MIDRTTAGASRPVSRAASIRAAKAHGGGPRRTDHVDFLNGLLWCVCGQKLWSEGWKDDKHRKRHRAPCLEWAAPERVIAATWELPIHAQLAQLDLSDSTIARVSRALAAPPPLADDVGRRRIERERRSLAEQYQRGGMSVPDFIAADADLGERLVALLEAPVASGITSDKGIEYLHDLAGTWRDGGERERADLAHAVYEKIEVRGPDFAAVTLTPDAEAHGLALALPERVNMRSIARGVRVGGEGLEPPTSSV